ncbi:MAG: hypothetical protein FIA92_15940 [Chloroflexi bacterium]|nr:hypothetical protein [Chloroflexota bacterium]
MTPDGPSLPVTGIVLAGGRGSRFGGPKLTAGVDGVPLLHRAILAVAAVAGEVVVVTRPDDMPDLPAIGVPIRLVHDPEPDGGPLVGLATGLRSATGAVSLVVGGDMPHLSPAVLGAMLSALGTRTGEAVLLASPDPAAPRQTLPLALETAAALPAADAAIQAGRRALQAALDGLVVVELAASSWLRFDPDGGTLDDVDEPADLERLAGRPIEAPKHGEGT